MYDSNAFHSLFLFFFNRLQAQRPENTVMQALESLNDSQVNDFLSGKTPLNLSMRLGDHMMLIQLQLSTVNPTNSTGSSSSSSSTSTSATASASSAANGQQQRVPVKSTTCTKTNRDKYRIHTNPPHHCLSSRSASSLPATPSTSHHHHHHHHHHSASATSTPKRELVLTNVDEKTPSTVVSSPVKTNTLNDIPMTSTPDPISAKLTSCLCKRFDANSNAGCKTDCQSSRSARSSSSLLRRTLNNPIARTHSGHHHHHHHRHCSASASTLRRSQSSDNVRLMDTDDSNRETPQNKIEVIDTAAGGSIIDPEANSDTLAEASRNLTKTLQKLSKEVLHNKVDVAAIAEAEETTNVRSRASTSGATSSSTSTNATSNQVASNSSIGNVSGVGSGAVIESMRNHGRGIYSGTFSGTLNPALQDRYGRPKRDISTVIHILNDLLSATPHYSRGARISFEPAQSSRSIKYVSIFSPCTLPHFTYHTHPLLLSSQSSSKRSSNGSGSSSSSSHSHRDHCSKCVLKSDSKTYVCRRTPGTHSSRHDVDRQKPSSLPSTPVTSAAPSLDCHQCHTRLTSSAPVTPTSTSQSISFNDASFTDESIASSVPSSPEVSVCAPATPLATPTVSNPICVKCSNIEIENSKTKSKLDQLRLVMQQRRERREARKMKAAPYGARIIGATAMGTSSTITSTSNESTNNTSVIQTTIDGPSASSAIVEPVDTLA